MKIENNIIKHYLKNVYFINGTAYAGKSTMCKMLAETYGLIHCGENYCADDFLAVAVPDLQPNMCYFRSLNDWQQFLHRTPKDYEAWIRGNSREMAEFEIAELIRVSGRGRVIVDTNIPIDMLKQIADYHQVAVMLSPQSMSVHSFFDRPDPEKQFLLEQIMKAENPEETLRNFQECIALINSREHYEAWRDSGFFTVTRENANDDTRMETLGILANHFGLGEKLR